MKQIIRHRSLVATLRVTLTTAIFISFLGCSTEENSENKGTGFVKITLGDINEGTNEADTRALKESETVEVLLGNGITMSCTLSPDSTSKTRSAKTALENGKKYRLVAYNNESQIKASEEGVVGETPPVLSLQPGDYTIVAYSFNSSSNLPAGETVEVPASTDLLYFSQTGVSIQSNQTSNVTVNLKHKFTQLTVIADASALVLDANQISGVNDIGKTISSCSATLGPGYNATLNVADGTLVKNGANTPTTLSWTGFNTKSLTSESLIIFTGGEPATINISSINIGGTTYTDKSIEYPNTLEAGKKYTMTTRFRKLCGAFISASVWKVFMCHNLGADETANAFIPSYKINGAYYRWNVKDPVIGNPTNASGADPAYSWNTSFYPYSSSWESSNNPCPSGYKVPTKAEWQAVIDNNTFGSMGTWSQSASNFSSAITFGPSASTYTLILPAAGYRAYTSGNLNNRGRELSYWSSTRYDADYGYMLGYPGWGLGTGWNYVRFTGAPVRCIAE